MGQLGGHVQQPQSLNKIDVALHAERVTDFTPHHLEAATDSHQDLACGDVRLDLFLPTVLSEPEQIRNGVFASGQDEHIGGARLPRLTFVIDNHAGNILQRGKVGEVGKVRQADHTHAQFIFAAIPAVRRRLYSAAFERNAVFIVNAVTAKIRNYAQARLR